MEKKYFKQYWDIMKKNYQDKTHTTKDLISYYSIFKDCSDEDFKIAVKECLKNQPYFPRIDELYKYIPRKQKEDSEKILYDVDGIMLWNGKRCEKEPISEEERKELEELLSELCNDS